MYQTRTYAPINSRLNVVVRSSTPFGLGLGSQLPRALPFIFFAMLSLEQLHKGSTQLLQNRSPVLSFSFLLLFSFPSLSFILLLLLMISNVHPNPGHLSLLCVCWKCDLAGQVSAMLHLLQMGPSKVLTTFPLQIQSSWQLSLLELPPLQHCDSLLELLRHVYSTVQSSPPRLMLHSRPTLVSEPLIPIFPFCTFSPCPHATVPCSWLSFYTSCHLFPLTLSRFFNGMLEVFKPGALNYFTFFRPILFTLSASRKPILTHLPLSGFLDSLLCVLIAPTPSLAFSLLMPRTLATGLSFSSGSSYLFLNFLPATFLCLIPTLIMYVSAFLLTTPPTVFS